MTTEPYERLIHVLERSEASYGTLLALLYEEKEAAIGSDAAKLTALVERKREILSSLASLERQRSRLLETLAGSLGLRPDQLTLSRLAQSLPGEKAHKIDSLRTPLKHMALESQRINEENRHLVSHCLELVHGALAFFNQMLQPASVYGATGRVHKNSGGGCLLSGSV